MATRVIIGACKRKNERKRGQRNASEARPTLKLASAFRAELYKNTAFSVVDYRFIGSTAEFSMIWKKSTP
jgi:hypothetical protein